MTVTATQTAMTAFTDEHGREFVLAGLAVPPYGSDPVHTGWREQIHTLVGASVDQRAVRVDWAGEAERDRWGRYRAVVTGVSDRTGPTLQEQILRTGLAQFAPEPATRGITQRALAAERVARIAQKQMWSDGRFHIRTPTGFDTWASNGVAKPAWHGRYVLVQGRVVAVQPGRSGAILRFTAPGWRGVEARVAAGARDRLGDGDMFVLQHAYVRVRGVLRAVLEQGNRSGRWRRFRPVIDLSEAGQVRRLI